MRPAGPGSQCPGMSQQPWKPTLPREKPKIEKKAKLKGRKTHKASVTVCPILDLTLKKPEDRCAPFKHVWPLAPLVRLPESSPCSCCIPKHEQLNTLVTKHKPLPHASSATFIEAKPEPLLALPALLSPTVLLVTEECILPSGLAVESMGTKTNKQKREKERKLLKILSLLCQ